MSELAISPTARSLVTIEAITGAIDSFTAMDQAADRQSLNALAQRLGREQPALLQLAGRVQSEHGPELGQAAVFYATLAWAMYEKQVGRALPQLLPRNLVDARQLVDGEVTALEGASDKPVQERLAASVVARQPHMMAKMQELFAEDIKENAMTAEGAAVVFPLLQTVVEAFDAAIEGRRPGRNMQPIVREAPKVGRNDVCPCGSGKKYKRCCGVSAA